MSDVVWRLTVTRDPNAPQTLAQWEQTLLASQTRVDRARVRSAMNADRMIANARTQSLQAQEREYQAFLNRQARMYQAFLNAQVRASRQAGSNIPAPFGGSSPGMPGAPSVSGIPGGGSGRGRGRGVGLPFSHSGGYGSSVSSWQPPPPQASNPMFGEMFGGLARRFLPAATAYGAFRFGQSAVNSYSQREMLEVRLGTLTGSKSGADRMLGGLKDLAAKTGGRVNDLADAANTMAGFNVPLDSVIKRLTQLSVISQGDTERMKRLALAFAQASGQGRLMGEELNQMIDAGFNPLLEISRTTGKSVTELRDIMHDGGLTIEMVGQAMDSLTGKGGKLGGMMEAMKDTTTKSLNSMSMAWEEFRVSIGRGLAGFEIAGHNVLNKSSEGISSALSFMGTQGENLLNLIGGAKSEASATKLQKSWEAGALEGAKTMRAAGYKSTDKVGSIFEVANRHAQNAALKLQGMSPMENMITQTDKNALQLLELTERENKLVEKREKKEQDIAAYKKSMAQYWEDFAKKELHNRASEMMHTKSVSEIRLKAAKEELTARQDMLRLADQQLKKAQEGLLSAQERFGQMSNKEQQEAIGLLAIARKRGPQNLSLEQLNKLRSIGTVEAESIAKAGFLHRGSAAFGAGNLNALQGRRDAVMDEIRKVENQSFSTPIGKARQAKKLDELRTQLVSIDGANQANFDAVRERQRMRDSVFAGERQQVVQARMQRQTIEANVTSQINLVYKLDDQIAGLTQQLAPMLLEAEQRKMEALAKALKPIREQLNALQLRAAAANPGGR